MKRIALAVTVLVSLLAGSLSVLVASWTAAAAALPYPQSKLVTGLAWDSAVVRIGDGTTGDNWPVTWADDDRVYASYGDGDGFSNRSPKLSLGFATLSGSPPSLTGQDFSSNVDTPEGQGPNGIKASGMLMVDGTLYMFVRNYKPAGSNDFSNARLAWSTDHGRNWTWANWAFADTFGAPDFIQFGKNYAGARDGYAYILRRPARRSRPPCRHPRPHRLRFRHPQARPGCCSGLGPRPTARSSRGWRPKRRCEC